jgi:hypothetical protein
LIVSLSLFLSGVLLYFALVATTMPLGRASLNTFLGLLLYATAAVVAPLVVYWTLCVAALMLTRRLLSGLRPVVLFPIVGCVVLVGLFAATCSALPTCSAQEMLGFSVVYGILGLIGGAGFVWSHR